jgi:Txe/YoeB family toxin of Txe-Axe toxin-antitoxin module
MNKTVAFTSVAFAEYNEWFETDRQMVERIKALYVILTEMLLKA